MMLIDDTDGLNCKKQENQKINITFPDQANFVKQFVNANIQFDASYDAPLRIHSMTCFEDEINEFQILGGPSFD